jgi:cell wall-associated NlpC family hydrolase
MNLRLTRRDALLAIAGGALAPGALAAFAREPVASPGASRSAPGSMYRLAYKHKHEDLVGDLLRSERGDPQKESITPHREWYSAHIRKTMGAWGPRPRRYAVPVGLAENSSEWKRERVIATAARFLGYGYQHHHIPDWDPPADWPWKTTCVGHNGKGFDCSNFTSFVYNQGFGLHMSSAIVRQSELKHATAGEESVPLERIALPRKYAERHKVLHTGDLLYIRGREDGPITHVVLWVGSVGRSPDDLPLVIDSHGSGVKDEEGQAIPCGVHVRPFREDSWYNRCASHAHRVWKA